MTFANGNESIDFASSLSAKDFQRIYVSGNRPVLLCGDAGTWPCIKKWSFDYLARRVGDVVVRMEFSPTGLFDPNTNTGRPSVDAQEIPLGQALSFLKASHEDGAYYMRETALEGGLYPLRRDLGHVPQRPKFVHRFTPRLWIGCEGAASPLHYDGGDANFLVHVSGRKQFDLYSPDDTKHLYPNRDGRLSHLSLVDPLHPDLRAFPLFAKARRLRVVLEPGDVLFVPPWWWHSTLSLSTSISVNFWWHDTWLSRLLYGRSAPAPEPAATT